MKLTKRQRQLLTYMLDPDDDDGSLVGDKGQWWFSTNRTNWRVVMPLIQFAILKHVEEGEPGGFEVYSVRREEAEKVLADPNYDTRMERAIRTGKPVYD